MSLEQERRLQVGYAKFVIFDQYIAYLENDT